MVSLEKANQHRKMIPPTLIATGIIPWMLVFFSCTFDPAGIPDFSQTNNENTDADINEFCGNNIREGTEVCDGPDLDRETCISQGYERGELACLTDCSGFDTSACEGSPGPVCGNNITEYGETCDGTDLDGETCISQGFNFGDLACLEDCSGFDTSACITASCGNNVTEYGETCDGTDLDGETCISQGFNFGDLACLEDCSGFDTSACITSTCGNNITEYGETCDGSDLDGETCISQGFDSGVLACFQDCSGFDTSGCGECGDGIKNGDEECDDEDMGGVLTCEDINCRSNGFVSCNYDCTFNISECISGHDEDDDGIDDNCDNCPSYYNPGQADANNDGIGDVCEYPDDHSLLSSIIVFDPFLDDIDSWTNRGGDWIYGGDIAGGSSIEYVGQLVHDHHLPNFPYGVEATFYYDQAPPEGLNLAGVAFARYWSEGIYAYMCVFNRISTAISIWRISGTTTYNWLAGVATNTTATDSDWHKIHVFYNGTRVTCNYSDQTGTQASLEISGSSDVWSDMSGWAGLALSNEHAVFKSFVIYR